MYVFTFQIQCILYISFIWGLAYLKFNLGKFECILPMSEYTVLVRIQLNACTHACISNVATWPIHTVWLSLTCYENKPFDNIRRASLKSFCVLESVWNQEIRSGPALHSFTIIHYLHNLQFHNFPFDSITCGSTDASAPTSSCSSYR
jgi:hypothetical protein